MSEFYPPSVAAEFVSAELAAAERLRGAFDGPPGAVAVILDPAEVDGPDDWIYCPECGSCGIGGCCWRYCPTCRDRHDEADEREDAQGIGEGAL